MIRTIKRQKPITRRFMREMHAQLMTLNQKKIGKHRRGKLLLSGAEWSGHELTFRWSESKTAAARFVDTKTGRRYRIQLFRFADHGKLLKVAHSG